MPWRDGVDDASFDGFVGQFLRRPVGDWAAAVGRGLTGDAEDPRQLLWAERWRHPWAWSVAKELDQMAEARITELGLRPCLNHKRMLQVTFTQIAGISTAM